MTAVTPAAEFRARLEGEVVTLPPTGRVVRIKAVKPAELLRLGDIPDVLADLVIKFLYGSLTNEEYDAFFSPKEKKEQALQMIDSLRIVCACALINPVISDTPIYEGDEIHIDDLEDVEQRFIFDLAMLGASSLRDFREKQEATLESVVDEQDPGPETVEPDSGEG